MSLFDFIFSRSINPKEVPKKTEPSIVIPDAPTPEYASLLQFAQRLNLLLLADKYLARSDYRQLIDDYAEINTFFANLKTAKTLGFYSSANGIQEASIEAFLRNYSDLANLKDGFTLFIRGNHGRVMDYCDYCSSISLGVSGPYRALAFRLVTTLCPSCFSSSRRAVAATFPPRLATDFCSVKPLGSTF